MTDRKRNTKSQKKFEPGLPRTDQPALMSVTGLATQPVRASTPTLWVASGRKLTENLRNPPTCRVPGGRRSCPATCASSRLGRVSAGPPACRVAQPSFPNPQYPQLSAPEQIRVCPSYPTAAVIIRYFHHSPNSRTALIEGSPSTHPRGRSARALRTLPAPVKVLVPLGYLPTCCRLLVSLNA